MKSSKCSSGQQGISLVSRFISYVAYKLIQGEHTSGKEIQDKLQRFFFFLVSLLSLHWQNEKRS